MFEDASIRNGLFHFLLVHPPLKTNRCPGGQTKKYNYSFCPVTYIYSNSLDISVVSSNLSCVQGVGAKDQICPGVRLVLLKLVISGEGGGGGGVYGYLME